MNISNAGYGGVGTYSIVFGSLGSGVTTDFISETQVKTAGFEAEFGQSTGGVVNVVTSADHLVGDAGHGNQREREQQHRLVPPGAGDGQLDAVGPVEVDLVADHRVLANTDPGSLHQPWLRIRVRIRIGVRERLRTAAVRERWTGIARVVSEDPEVDDCHHLVGRRDGHLRAGQRGRAGQVEGGAIVALIIPVPRVAVELDVLEAEPVATAATAIQSPNGQSGRVDVQLDLQFFASASRYRDGRRRLQCHGSARSIARIPEAGCSCVCPGLVPIVAHTDCLVEGPGFAQGVVSE